MTKLKNIIICTIPFAFSIYSEIILAQKIPSDTYFSLAVSENSHNHYGENLLFLDFAENINLCNKHPHTICAQNLNNLKNPSIKLDGKMDDWKNHKLTRIRGRLMNNYPLGEHYDATPTTLNVAATFDNNYVYFVINWEDANHDASINRNRWIFKQGKWRQQVHVKPKPGTPASKTTNIKEKLAGAEDEDQLFMMFPIVDQQHNFYSGGLGCAGYCHLNLSITADPKESQIGDGVSSMHTAIPDDTADLWHWTATRTAPMNTLKDGFIDYGDQSYNGRKTDAGSHSFENNGHGKPILPKFIHRGDFEAGKYQIPGYRTAQLTPENRMEITSDMKFAENVSIPFYIHKPATGSLADVATAAWFNETDNTWTVEIKRRLQTNDENDHQFMSGSNAMPPSHTIVAKGDPERGKKLFQEKTCSDCHGDNGEGTFVKGSLADDGTSIDDIWSYPRNQRTSAPAILKTVSINRPERMMALGAELEKHEEEPPRVLMPFVRLTPQEAEDIASWLQLQFIHRMK